MSYRDEFETEEEIRRRYERKRRRRKEQRRIRMLRRSVIGGTMAALTIVLAVGIHHTALMQGEETVMAEPAKYIPEAPDFLVELLDINEYSRPGESLEQVNGIVIHYTANPGTTAEQNRGYFEGLKDSHETYASSHFVIGIAGEIIQCIPCNEIAYASKDRNHDTIAIECCIPDETGKFEEATYQSLVRLTTWLMGRYELSAEDVIRHYDVTGKMCPKYYVENESAWEQFREDLLTYIDSYGIVKDAEVE